VPEEEPEEEPEEWKYPLPTHDPVKMMMINDEW
jgi:hypothetical protein